MQLSHGADHYSNKVRRKSRSTTKNSFEFVVWKVIYMKFNKAISKCKR